jgi:hypothetical protein
MTTAHESYPGDFKVTLDLYLDRWEVSCTAFRCDPDTNEDTL